MAALAVALGLTAAPAAAAPGDLVLAKCIGPVSGCSPTAPSAALDGAWDVAVTPDQRHLYATGYDSNSISHFTLDAAGSPTYVGCIGTLLGCTGLSPPALTADVRELVVSADGRHLYVASEGGDAIVHFTLDAAGTPAFANCVGNTAGCAPASPAGALADVVALVLSGENLYAAAFGAGAVSHLKLDGAGNPSWVGCTGVAAGCTSTTPSNALSGASDVDVTPDGRNLFVAAISSSNISRLTILANGSLVYISCTGMLAGCTPTNPANALALVASVAVGAEGRHLYAAPISGPLSHFTFDVAGDPVLAECLGNHSGCTPVSPAAALSNIRDLEPSPLGGHLYAGIEPGIEGAVTHLTLDGAGTPAVVGCTGSVAGCTPTSPALALRRTFGVAVSADGRQAYAAAFQADGIGHLTIEQPPPAGQAPVEQTPTAPPPAPPAGFGSATLVTLSLAAARIPASGPLRVRVVNRNTFRVAGRLSGRTVRRVRGLGRRVRLGARSFAVPASGRTTVRLRLPPSLRKLLRRDRVLRLALTAVVRDPAGTTRRITKRVSPRLRLRR